MNRKWNEALSAAGPAPQITLVNESKSPSVLENKETERAIQAVKDLEEAEKLKKEEGRY